MSSGSSVRTPRGFSSSAYARRRYTYSGTPGVPAVVPTLSIRERK